MLGPSFRLKSRDELKPCADEPAHPSLDPHNGGVCNLSAHPTIYRSRLPDEMHSCPGRPTFFSVGVEELPTIRVTCAR